jgi:hypothetical protein
MFEALQLDIESLLKIDFLKLSVIEMKYDAFI